jgi:hypothetical protein
MWGFTPKQRPFLVDLDAGDGSNLIRLSRQEADGTYHCLVGFNAHEDAGIYRVDLFTGPVRFTHCLDIPWVIYCKSSPQKAVEAVAKHPHPETRLHLETLRDILAKTPPKFVHTTIIRK